jgi:hypothetical protein
MMNDQNINTTNSADKDFFAALGWLATAAVSIASWAGLS